MIIKKKKMAPFIRGPIYLSPFEKFRNLGMGPLLLLFHYNWKFQMQKLQQRKTNKYWPVPNDCRYVKLTNISPFWRRPQQKYEAIRKCEAANLIEGYPTKKYEAAIIRVLGEKEVSDEKKK